MALSRPELEQRLNALEKQMPALLEANPDDADFWPAFAGIAEDIEESASAADSEFVRARIDCILGAAGLIPSDNEGEECSNDPNQTPDAR